MPMDASLACRRWISQGQLCRHCLSLERARDPSGFSSLPLDPRSHLDASLLLDCHVASDGVELYGYPRAELGGISSCNPIKT